ncbi:MAG: polymerase sigma-70 factor [Mucilaginibacter sp.]|nr:polymerase sigma-70 factor [Mucilaginibacter sp.]
MAAYGKLSDQELTALLKEGNHAAFTEIYHRYWDKLYVVAYTRLADETEAEEAVQNIFLGLWKRRETLYLTHSLTTYLSVAVKYQVLTRLAQIRRERKRSDQLKINVVEGKETTHEWLSEKELKQKIERCIDELPRKCRIVFRMSREQGLSNARIAEELHIAEKTVEGHITNALSKLQNSLNIALPVLLTILENKLRK